VNSGGAGVMMKSVCNRDEERVQLAPHIMLCSQAAGVTL